VRKHSIGLDTPIETTIAVSSLSLDDDLIVIDMLSDRSFRLNATGRRIWMLLQGRPTLGDLSTALADEFGLERQVAEEAAQEFVGELIDLRLATVEETFTEHDDEGGER
jgi:hypothetical protein